jgi:hypothetical protein
MRTYLWTLAAVIAATFAMTGCSKKAGTVDTTPLEKNFQSADPATKSTVDKAVSDIQASNYSGALADLKTLADNAKLTPEQQQAVKDVAAQVEQAFANTAAKAQGQANKSMDGMKKALPH